MKLAIEKSCIKSTIHEHREFLAFMEQMEALFDKWRKRTVKKLKAIQPGFKPKALIAELGKSLLKHYEGQALVSNYDVYQHLMDYWSETMQDDCYLIAADGWKAEASRIIVKDKKGKEKDKGWNCELVPKVLIVARYFAVEQAALTKLESQLESIASQLAELEEEHGGEEGLFVELDKVNKANIGTRLKEIKGDKDAKDETKALKSWLKLNKEQAAKKKAIKEADAALDAKAYAKYPTLSENEVKTLVVDDKWLSALADAIHGEMDRISQALTRRVKELAERYETPLPNIGKKVEDLEQRVSRHLAKMGFSWK